MGEITTYKELLKAGMAAAMPARVVTRDHKDFALRDDADLIKGVVTIIGMGEGEYAQYLGRMSKLGTLKLLIVGQVKVIETATPSAVEDAEDALMEEIKAFCASPPAGLGSLNLLEYRQSGQLDHPHGWISVDVEVLT